MAVKPSGAAHRDHAAARTIGKAAMRSLPAADNYILGKGLETNSVFLHDGDRDMTGLACLDVGNRTTLACMGSAYDIAERAVHELA